MRKEAMIQKAMSLCIQIEAVKECPVHDGSYIDAMWVSNPAELTTQILDDQPDALVMFDSEAHMVDCVGEAMSRAGIECPCCGKDYYA